MDAEFTPKRPRRVTIFSLLVLLLGSGLNLARAVWALDQSNALTGLSLSTSMPMGYLFGTSVAWGLVFGVCGLGLWWLRPWGRTGTLAAVTSYHAHIWANHIAFDRSDYARQVWPFAVVHSLVVLGSVWVFLNWSSIQRVFDKRGSRMASVGEEK